MTINVKVQITTGIDLTDLQSRLEGPALSAFEDSGKEMHAAIQRKWVGWKYKGRNLSTVGRSRLGWSRQYQATEGIRTITFSNNARGHYSGKPYAGYVARKKGATEEWRIVQDILTRDYLPKLIARVTEALQNALTGGRRVKVRTNKSTTHTVLNLEE